MYLDTKLKNISRSYEHRQVIKLYGPEFVVTAMMANFVTPKRFSPGPRWCCIIFLTCDVFSTFVAQLVTKAKLSVNGLWLGNRFVQTTMLGYIFRNCKKITG